MDLPHVPRLIPPVAAGLAVAAQRLLPRPSQPSRTMKIAATGLAACAAAVAGAAVAKFRQSGTTLDPAQPEESSVLVTDGVNAFTRNPMYLGLTGVVTAHALWRQNPWGLLPAAGLWVWLDRKQIPAEERALEKIHPQAYREYQESVPRWVGSRSFGCGEISGKHRLCDGVRGRSGSGSAASRLAPGVWVGVGALGLCSALHLGVQIFEPDGLLADATQILLMPALAAAFHAATGGHQHRLVPLVSAALVFSWLGDTIPRFVRAEPGFLALVLSFLAAQGTYIAAFWPYRATSLLCRPWGLAPYVLALAGLVVRCAPQAGQFLLPVLLYGISLSTMAVLATGLGPLAGAGAASFLASDAMIAFRSFTDLQIPVSGFWIISTYVLGQSLLAWAVARKVQEDNQAAEPAGLHAG